ncbi:MAG: phosphoglycerate dehydrogenase [Dehalococcoidales bacterium]|nr:phosphoglycerate dehydrogenase [Dehalococcoidales bacterium]
MAYKVVVGSRFFGKFAPEAEEILREAGCTLVRDPDALYLNEQRLLGLVPDADAIITGVDPITPPVLEAAGRLKIVAKHGVGVDNIDIPTATRRGVIVSTAVGSNDTSVAELAFALMLASARRISVADRQVRTGTWPRFVGTELSGKTLGLVGLGRIGKGVALRALAFGMKVVAYDVYQNAAFAAAHDIAYVPLDDLLAQADFISVHVPLMESTRYLIDEPQLRKMKPSAYLVNTSRGPVVREAALYKALKEGWIAGAALDVFEREPATGSPLLELANLIATTHMGADTKESHGRMSLACARAVLAALHGERPAHVVNPEVFETARG